MLCSGTSPRIIQEPSLLLQQPARFTSQLFVLEVIEEDFSEDEMSLESEYQFISPDVRRFFFSFGDSCM